MAKIILSADKAERTPHGTVTISFQIGGRNVFDDLRRVREVKNVADVRRELDEFAKEVALRAKPLPYGACCSVRLVPGERAPAGFRKQQWQEFVCLDKEAAKEPTEGDLIARAKALAAPHAWERLNADAKCHFLQMAQNAA